VCCSVVQCVEVCCRALRCVAVCCSLLQCVAVCLVSQYGSVLTSGEGDGGEGSAPDMHRCIYL